MSSSLFCIFSCTSIVKRGPPVPTIQDYELTTKLGTGAFATVYRATNSAGQIAACKVFEASNAYSARMSYKFEQEMYTFLSTKTPHVNILDFIDSGETTAHGTAPGTTPTRFLILELSPLSLLDLIGECIAAGKVADPVPGLGVPQDLARFFFLQIGAGIVSSPKRH